MIAVGTEALPLFTALPDTAPVRTSDPETSHLAAERLRNLTKRHEAVWRVLRALGPSADFEIEAAYDRFGGEVWWVAQTAQSIRSRRKMLELYGLVVTDGERRPSPNGRNPARVWAAVAPSRAERLFEGVK